MQVLGYMLILLRDRRSVASGINLSEEDEDAYTSTGQLMYTFGEARGRERSREQRRTQMSRAPSYSGGVGATPGRGMLLRNPNTTVDGGNLLVHVTFVRISVAA